MKRLRENFVHGAEAEKIRHQIRESRNHAIIASLEVRLQETEDKYWGTISAINENFVNVTESSSAAVPHAVVGRHVGNDHAQLRRDRGSRQEDSAVQGHGVHAVSDFRHRCQRVHRKTSEFGDDEWLDIMINSIGLNPEHDDTAGEAALHAAAGAAGRSQLQLHRTGPAGKRARHTCTATSATITHVLSGGKATPASLFINNANGKVGMVGSRDAVVFDEIANTDFTDPKALVSIMQGYMQDAKFSRGKKEILAHASIVLVGNLDVQNKLPHEKYYHLFEPLPSFLQVEAFIDRLHCYTPGWEIPKIRPDSMSQDYGFITDYFC